MKASAKKLIKSAPVDPNLFTDNKLEEAMQRIGFKSLLSQSGFRKQKGDPLLQVMFALLIWLLLEVRSLSIFCGKFLKAFITGGMSALYDFQKRQEKTKAFVFDDSLKERQGNKVQATSTPL